MCVCVWSVLLIFQGLSPLSCVCVEHATDNPNSISLSSLNKSGYSDPELLSHRCRCRCNQICLGRARKWVDYKMDIRSIIGYICLNITWILRIMNECVVNE